MNISCLEELQLKFDLCLSRDERLSILTDAGKKIKTDKWFVTTDDGQCHLFDRDGNLDDISKVSKLHESYVRKDIKRICIPNGVTSIESYAFYYCSGLKSMTIPDSVTYIGDGAFSGCSGLKSMTIPDSVTYIGDGAFYDCSDLMRMTIPDSVISIGDCAFYGCISLTSIIFKGKTRDQVKAMDNYPFGIDNTCIIHVE